MRKFLDPNDIRLNTFSREISVGELSSTKIKSILDDMVKIAIGERDDDQPDRPSLVGLSAPQIGEFVRIILVDMAADANKMNLKPDIKFFINPKIFEASTVESPAREGCYSTGRICGAVIRPDWVIITALDEKGKAIEYRSRDIFQSHIIQHEIDHLNGIRFPSRVRNPNQLHYVEIDESQDYRNNWTIWKKLCPIGDWLKMYESKK